MDEPIATLAPLAVSPQIAAPLKPKGYWDLVALQFRKNTIAVLSLYTIALLFLIAAWAPLIANGKPFVWTRDGKTTFPLIEYFIAPEFNVDLVFNYFCLTTITLPLAFALKWALQKAFQRTFENRPFWMTAFFIAATPFLSMQRYDSTTPDRSTSTGEIIHVFSFLLMLVIVAGAFRLITGIGQLKISRRAFWICSALMALLISFFIHSGFRKNVLDQRIPYPVLAAELHPEKGDRAVFAVVGQDPISMTPNILKAPDGVNLLGTDSQGRDVLARMLHGARVSLSVGFVAESVAVILGIIMGALAGFYRGWIDIAISRLIEVVICFPSFFLILVVIAYSETRSIFYIMVVIGVTNSPGIARLVRGEFLRLVELEYVQSARALGASPLRLMFRHMLPNAMGPVLVSAAFGVAGAILTESALSYLGFGPAPPTPTWGEMISQGNDNLQAAWWLIVFPGLSIFLTVTIYNLVGDGLRDAMDPKMRK